MTTITDICNLALTKIGEERATNIENENTIPARLMAFIFDNVRRSELESYFWTFALKRAVLAPLTSAPVLNDDFSVKYKLPNDYLTIYKIIGNPDYMIEGDELLTNESSILKLVYVSDTKEYNKFSSLFIDALACRLALEAIEDRTQSNTKFQRVYQQYQQTIERAQRMNAISLPPQDYNKNDDWLDARL